jgi:hypothetical protein
MAALVCITNLDYRNHYLVKVVVATEEHYLVETKNWKPCGPLHYSIYCVRRAPKEP